MQIIISKIYSQKIAKQNNIILTENYDTTIIAVITCAFLTEIVKNVKNSNNPPNHFRPKIEFLNSNGVWETEHEDVINIMTKCWHEDPLERPTFSALKGIIRKINK